MDAKEMQDLLTEIRESVAQSQQDQADAADREANGFPRPTATWGDDSDIGWN